MIQRLLTPEIASARLELRASRLFALVFALLPCFAQMLHAQDNYEIQVYGADTVAPKTIMFELHSNYTIDGF